MYILHYLGSRFPTKDTRQEASDPLIADTRFNNDKAAPVISGERHFDGMSFLIRFESTPVECKAASDT